MARKTENKQTAGEPVEVWLLEPGEGRPPFSFHGPLEYLPPEPPHAQVGDIILLPRNVTGDTKAQSFAWGGTLTPFKVVEREHVYFRDKGEKVDPRKVKPARYVRSMILVRRLSQDEYAGDPNPLL
jgi:hypothetical protein